MGQARWSLGGTGRYERGSAIAANRPLFASAVPAGFSYHLCSTLFSLSFPHLCYLCVAINGTTIDTVCTQSTHTCAQVFFFFFEKRAMV